jgi:pimeloyl-ACP methyl ester carboxylesterase
MAFVDVDGTRIRYELLGSGPPFVLTPGGRLGMDVPGLRPLAEDLASDFTVVLWDRPNAGASDVVFTGESESDMWADYLAGMLRELGLGPAVVGGGSAGARTSLLAGIRQPDSIAAVVTWNVSGGHYGTFSLGASYILPTLDAVHRGGMAAVAKVPEWADRIAENPANEERILSQDRAAFTTLLDRWLEAYIPDRGGPVAGITDDAIRGLTTPLLVIQGDATDHNHPAWVSQHVFDLVDGAVMAEPPWPDGEWIRLMAEVQAGREDVLGRWRLYGPILRATLPGLLGAERPRASRGPSSTP